MRCSPRRLRSSSCRLLSTPQVQQEQANTTDVARELRAAVVQAGSAAGVGAEERGAAAEEDEAEWRAAERAQLLQALGMQQLAELGRWEPRDPLDEGLGQGADVVEHGPELGIAVPVELLLQPLPMNFLDQHQHVEVTPALPPIPRPWRC